MRNLPFIISLLFSASFLQAQNCQIKLVDAKNLEVLAGVELRSLSGRLLGISATDGIARVEVSSGDSIRFHRLGYVPAKIRIHENLADSCVIIVELIPDNALLYEVDVTASFEGKHRDGHLVEKMSAEQLLDRGVQTLSLALSELPGVQSVQTGVSISKPMIRGMSGSRVKVMDRGLSLEGQQWGMDHSLEMDPFRVQETEVIKGPEAVIYGSDAIGGVLRFLPPRLPEVGMHGSLNLLYRQNNQGIGGSAALEGRSGKLFFHSRLSTQHFGEYRVPADEFTYNGFILPIPNERLQNTSGNEWAADLIVGRLLKNGGREMLNANVYALQAGLFPGAIGIPRENDLRFYTEQRQPRVPLQDVQHYRMTYKRDQRHENGWFHFDLGWQWNDRRELSPPHSHGYIQSDPNNTEALAMSLHTLSFRMREEMDANEAGLQWEYGADGSAQFQEVDGFEYLVPAYQRYQAGAFGLLRWKPNKTSSYSISLRADGAYHESQEEFRQWFGAPDSMYMRSPHVEKRFFNVVYGFSWSRQIDELQSAYAHIGRSFRFPVAAELASNGVHHGTFRHELGDPNINAEHGHQLDLGWSYRSDVLSLKLSGFAAYFNNFIYLSPSGRFSPLPDAGQIYRYRQDRVWTHGTELSVHYPFLQNWEWTGLLEYTYAQNLRSQLPLPFIPPLLVRNKLEWSKAGWTASGEWVAAAAQFRTDRNEEETPAYQLIHLGLSKEWGDFLLGLTLRNALNTVYLNHLSRYRILNLPEQGRNLIIRASYSF